MVCVNGYDRLGYLTSRYVAPYSHIMMTSSNGNIIGVTDPLCEEFTGHQWNHLTKWRDRGFDIFFDLCPNKRLSKQS